MELEVINVRETGQGQLTVTVAGPNQPDTISTEARALALRVARPHLGRCGVSGFGEWGYRAPDGTVLTEAELTTPGKGVTRGGLYTKDIVVNAGL